MDEVVFKMLLHYLDDAPIRFQKLSLTWQSRNPLHQTMNSTIEGHGAASQSYHSTNGQVEQDMSKRMSADSAVLSNQAVTGIPTLHTNTPNLHSNHILHRLIVSRQTWRRR